MLRLFRIVVTDRTRCKSNLHVRFSGSSVIQKELRCILRINHQGPHRDGTGAVWDNWANRVENINIAGEAMERKGRAKPEIFLP